MAIPKARTAKEPANRAPGRPPPAPTHPPQQFPQLTRPHEPQRWHLAQAAAGQTATLGAGRAHSDLATALGAGRAPGEADLEAFAAIELASL
ncbi:MAG: hypothetical protein KY443_04275, partial [Actinobacteria bacterium]|nr:hypothetical protein [Actinomycetota bacterium]